MEAQLKQIPPTYQGGRPWTNKLLNALSVGELKRLIATYGANAINAAVAKNAAQGVK